MPGHTLFTPSGQVAHRRLSSRAIPLSNLFPRSEKPLRPIRVLLIDDDSPFLETVADLLRFSPVYQIVGAFVSARQALQNLDALSPDVALVDILMPEMNGFDCARTILQQRSQTAVVLVTGATASRFIQTAIQSDVWGFLSKPFTGDELRSAIQAAAHGMFLLNSAALEGLRQEKDDRRAGFVAEKKLNVREVRVLDCPARFLENKEIADELDVSIPVVQKILQHVYHKLGVRTRAEAIVVWNAVR